MTAAALPFVVVAQNLPSHARNPIHTDAGAQAAGFVSALVAGVTTYAYLCHPPIAAWGLDWVANGSGEVRFRSPVYAGETISCTPTADGQAFEAVGSHPDQPAVRARLVTHLPDAHPVTRSERIADYRMKLDGEFGSDYAELAGDPLTLCRDHGVVHPAVWPALANHIVHRELAQGSWIHLRTRFEHHTLAPVGAVADIESTVIDRYERSGQRAVVNVRIRVDGIVTASLEHEAIIRLAAAD